MRSLTRREPRSLFDDRHLAAETPEHLRKLESDVAAADHQQMAWNRLKLQDGGAGQVRHAVDAGHGGNHGAATDIPARLQRAAMGGPAWPAPTTIASKRIGVDLMGIYTVDLRGA